MKTSLFLTLVVFSYVLGQMFVDSYIDESETPQLRTSTQIKTQRPRTQIIQPQSVKYITNHNVELEEKTVNHFHFPDSPRKDSENLRKTPDQLPQKIKSIDKFEQEVKSKTKVVKNTISSSSSSSTTSAHFDDHFESYYRHKMLLHKLELGVKNLKDKGQEFPAVYVFYSANLDNKPISLKWVGVFENYAFTRTIKYSSTKNGLNRAIIFIDRKQFPQSELTNDEFLSKLNIRLSFIIDGKEFNLKKANIGKILAPPSSIQEVNSFKSRDEVNITLSDNYNPILKN